VVLSAKSRGNIDAQRRELMESPRLRELFDALGERMPTGRETD
jgi:hypothetical protein